MNKFLSIIFLLFCFNLSFSQVINGKIVDENNLALYGVSVYFDGTTIGTTTNSEGIFELQVQSIPTATLVISYLGYESIYLNTFQAPLHLKLKPNAIALKEVILEPVPFTRKEMLEIFREQFLGKTKGGKNCVILNEEVIQFSYESKTYKLTAFADEKLKIKNNYLGYLIDFELVDFYVLFTKRSVSSQYVKSSFYAGTTFYNDLSTAEQSYLKNRASSYTGSSMHFFKNLTTNTWGKKEFVLYEGSFPTNPELFFEVTDYQNVKKVTIKNQEKYTSSFNGNNKFYKSFNLLFDKKEQSKVTFRTPVFYVDAYGNHTNIDAIDFSGEISKKRFGDMLPTNFVLLNALN